MAVPSSCCAPSCCPSSSNPAGHARSLRFWSAACSSGQEAYSLAMLLLEHFPLLAGWNIRIEGTDICAEVVERAQAGCYHRIEMNRGLPARYVVSYFDHAGENWTVKPEIRKMCNFRQANLCSSPLPFNRSDDRFDVIFLRNVMLYFSQETRKTLLAGIHKVAGPRRHRSSSAPASSPPIPPSGPRCWPAAPATSALASRVRKQGSGYWCNLRFAGQPPGTGLAYFSSCRTL